MGAYNTSQIAILQTVCNKYNPGVQVFKLQAITGMQNNTNKITNTRVTKNFIMNEDIHELALSSVNTTSCIRLEVPKHIVSRYPTKYIPQGTRFIVDFQNGDISKPIITGCEF